MNAPHDFAPLFTTCFRGVLQASWQGALAILLVLLARRALGARVPARWHYLLWFLVLVRLLVPAVVLPRSPTSLENIHVIVRPFEHLSERGARQTVIERSSVNPPLRQASPWRSSAMSSAPLSIAARHPWPWEMIAALVWLAGSVAGSIWMVGCVVGLQWKLRRETFPVEAKILRLWHACCRRWLRRTPPRIVEAAWVASPALVGVWRPTADPPAGVGLFHGTGLGACVRARDRASALA